MEVKENCSQTLWCCLKVVLAREEWVIEIRSYNINIQHFSHVITVTQLIALRVYMCMTSFLKYCISPLTPINSCLSELIACKLSFTSFENNAIISTSAGGSFSNTFGKVGLYSNTSLLGEKPMLLVMEFIAAIVQTRVTSSLHLQSTIILWTLFCITAFNCSLTPLYHRLLAAVVILILKASLISQVSLLLNSRKQYLSTWMIDVIQCSDHCDLFFKLSNQEKNKIAIKFLFQNHKFAKNFTARNKSIWYLFNV